MPAVQLARLNQQTDALVWQFTRPADFLIKVRDLFEIYADRVYKPGLAVPPVSMIPAYHVPPFIMRHLVVELRASCRQHPAAAINLVDTLWNETMLEFRLLGAHLLGMVPLNNPEPVVERLVRYGKGSEEYRALAALLEFGGQSLRKELPDRWILLLDDWGSEKNESTHALCLRAIAVTAADRNFQNLPAVYRIFSEFFQQGQNSLKVELQEALHSLLQRSPKETVFLLRQMLPLSTSPTTLRLIRLSMPHIPVEYQANLRQALQSAAPLVE